MVVGPEAGGKPFMRSDAGDFQWLFLCLHDLLKARYLRHLELMLREHAEHPISDPLLVIFTVTFITLT